MEVTYDSSLTESIHSRSCDNCKAKKLKCDRHHPCGTCARKQQDCSYVVADSNKKRKRSVGSSLNKSKVSGSLVVTPQTISASPIEFSAATAYSTPPASGLDRASPTQLSVHESPAQVEPQQQLNPALCHWPENPTFDVFDYNNVWEPDFDLDEILPDYLYFGSPVPNGTAKKPHVNTLHVERLLSLYVKQIHPSVPVCQPDVLLAGLHSARYEEDRHFAALLAAVCAFISLQAPAPHKSNERGKQYLMEAHRLFRDDLLGEKPTLATVLASFFIFGCQWSLGYEDSAWLKLQETINLSKLLHLEDDALCTPDSLPQWEARMYFLWGLFFVERVFAAGREHQLCITIPTMKSLDTFIDVHASRDIQEQRNAAALRILVESFGQLDDDVLLCWRSKCLKAQGSGSCQELTQDRLAKMLSSFPTQQHPQWQTLFAPPVDRAKTEFEATVKKNDGGDVLLTSIWLQNRLWHLGRTHELLDTHNANPYLRFDYAITLANEAVTIFKAMRVSGFEGHGQGLTEKLYSIVCDFFDIAEWLGPNVSTSPSLERLEEPNLQPEVIASFSISDSNIPSMSDSIEATVLPKAKLSLSPVRSYAEIATGFLGFYAMFNNGQHDIFPQFMSRYQSFMVNIGQYT